MPVEELLIPFEPEVRIMMTPKTQMTGTGSANRRQKVSVWGGTFLLLLSLLIVFPAQAQFGKNKVNYQTFDWYYIQTEHFDIYHPKAEYKMAEFAGWEAENALRKIQEDWGYKLQGRITFVVYPSQNTFQSNNVGFGEQDESTGGFTEFLKNRVVIPYQGSYEMFRHVIHHELTHAVMLRMLYGEGVQSIITGLSRLPMPLWYIEGMAEFESIGDWDNDSDMYMRDAVVNDFLPPIQYIGGYFNYKGGQSILHYIKERYGEDKVGELQRRIRNERDFNRALKSAIGIDIKELSDRWHKYLKREIWPTSAEFESPEDFATKVTDHLKAYNYINTTPALSPEGDRLVMLSDKDDYMSIYLVNTVTGEIVEKVVSSGASIYLFEQLLWVRPWIDWSPDGQNIAFVAESGGRDVLYTLNVDKAEITGEYRYELDGLFSPSWSPDGKQIVFTAHKLGQSDLYAVEVGKPESLRKLTDDIFSDYDPDWGDGNAILFISDRGQYAGQVNEDFAMWEHNFSQIDVYLLNVDSGAISRLTDTPAIERTPTWTSKQDTISFVSDRTGAFNLYMMDVNNGDTYAVTDILTGVFTPSWSRRGTVAFSSYYHGGYDIYLYKNPFDPDRRKEPGLTRFQQRVRGLVEPEPLIDSETEEEETAFSGETGVEVNQYASTETVDSATDEGEVGQQEPVQQDTTAVSDTTTSSVQQPAKTVRGMRFVSAIGDEEETEESDSTATAEAETDSTEAKHITMLSGSGLVGSSRTGYKNFVFYSDGIEDPAAEYDLANENPDSILDEEGKFIQRKYEVKFSPDIVYASAGFSTFFGFQGYGQMMFSDVLGNHIILLGTDLYYNFENSNFSLFYLNQPNRYDWGGGVFQSVYYFNYGYVRDRNYGAALDLVYPISRTKRFGFSTSFVNVDRDEWDNQQYDYVPRLQQHFVVPTISYVYDDSYWGWTAPMNGSRYRISFTASPELSSANQDSSDDVWGVDFKTINVDARKYFHIGRDYDIGLRAAGGFSWGKNPEKFFLGGVNNWINRSYNENVRIDIDDVYFSEFITPMRGAGFYEREGDRYVLTNAEFRFPFIRQLFFGWPLPFFFYNVRGALFVDAGAAWNSGNFRGLVQNEYQQDTFGSIVMGFGWGTRINLGFAMLKFDIAWRNEYHRINEPAYYWSLGTDL